MLSHKQQELQVQCYALIQQALRQQERKLRRDRIDGLVAFLRRLVNRAGERSYLVLKPTVEERAWRKDVKEGSAERPVCAKTMQRYCQDLVELGLAKLRHCDQYTGITLLFLKKRKVSAPPREGSALTDSCGGLPPTEAKPSAVDGRKVGLKHHALDLGGAGVHAGTAPEALKRKVGLRHQALGCGSERP